jgi:fatty acid desaturase
VPNAEAAALAAPSLSTMDALRAATRHGSPYAPLLRQIQRAGLLDRRVGYYAWKIAATTALLAAGWTAFVLIGDSWWQLVVAAFLAVIFAQIGFLAHDAGHRQIFATRRSNDIAGILLANLAVGLGYSYWVDKHNRHHAHPNQLGKDPDIAAPVVAFTSEQAGGRGRYARIAYRYQAYFSVALLLLAAVALHVTSAVHLARGAGRHRTAERILFAAHLAGYFTVVFWVLSPAKAVVFVAVHQGLLGLYLGISFAPNHKSMPILAADDRSSFLHRQVLTSRNIRGSWLTDLALGGLNYQIEHHLFPSMPRPHLRRAQPIVQQFCAAQGLPYVQTGVIDSYAQTVRHLHTIGRNPHPQPDASTGAPC